MNWEEAQIWESDWHGNCANSFQEELKQYLYAHYMGLDKYATNYYGQRGWDFGDKKVLDVGCGPYSMLLKSKAKKRAGIDPCNYPEWVKLRYKECGIEFLNIPAEEMKFDEVFSIGLLYNCLQHTKQPEVIISNMKKYCKVIHVFEWLECGLSDGHIQNLTEEKMNNWLGGIGKVYNLNQSPLVGDAFFGTFKGCI